MRTTRKIASTLVLAPITFSPNAPITREQFTVCCIAVKRHAMDLVLFLAWGTFPGFRTHHKLQHGLLTGFSGR